MLKRIVLGQLRHMLGAGGVGLTVWLVNHGATTEDAELIVSAIIALVGFIWSVADKYFEEKKKQKEIIETVNKERADHAKNLNT
jgi:nitrogen fixation-related uncharacterized protein